MYKTYKDRATFILVYIREAHPKDGDRPDRAPDGPGIDDPKTMEERAKTAESCADDLDLSMTVLVDSMDDKTSKDFAAHPDRIYIVGKDGKVTYKGEPGPKGFKPDEAGAALKKLLEANP